MKKGKYRLLVTRSAEVQITVADEALFAQDFEVWKSRFADPAQEVTEQDFLEARAIMSVAGSTSEKYNRGIVIIHLHSDQDIEHYRTCPHCGCVDHEGCQLESGPCDWHETLDCCTNPACIAAAEKEVRND